MKEIKFRGKRVVNGEWVYGYYKYSKILHEHIIVSDEDCVSYTVIPETVDQCIGLDDKNGVKIFGGDVVRCCGGEYYQGTYEFSDDVEVKFETYALSWLHGADLLEVIGNIHKILN